MPWYIYSTEPLPNEEMMGLPGYTPDGETIRTGGASLPPIPAKKWMKLPDYFPTIRHRDWRDKSGVSERIYTESFLPTIKKTFAERGVILMDHEPSQREREQLEGSSERLNKAWRMSVIEAYEHAVRDREITGAGRTRPTPYEDECYSILGLTKPYSVEAMRAQRHPGEAVGEQIVAALERLEKRKSEESRVPAAK